MSLEPSLDLTLSKSKLKVAVRTSDCMYCKKYYRDCMYHSNCTMCVMVAIAIGLDCILTGIVVELIAISLDCVLMDANGGFDGGFDGGFNTRFDGRFNSGFDGGFNGRFHLAVLGY